MFLKVVVLLLGHLLAFGLALISATKAEWVKDHLVYIVILILFSAGLSSYALIREEKQKKAQAISHRQELQSHTQRLLNKLDQNYENLLLTVEKNIDPQAKKEIQKYKSFYESTFSMLKNQIIKQEKERLIEDWPYSIGSEGWHIASILDLFFFPNTSHVLSGPERYFVYRVFKKGGQADMSLIREIDDEFREVGYSVGTIALPMFHRLGQMNIFKKMPTDKIIFEEPYLRRTLDFSKFDSIEKFREYVWESYRRELLERYTSRKSN